MKVVNPAQKATTETAETRRLVDPDIPPREWLRIMLEAEDKSGCDGLDSLACCKHVSSVSLELCCDQKRIVGVVMRTLKMWLTADDLATFKPLRMTIIGTRGTGKTVVVRAIASAIRELLNCQEAVCVVAPTGESAFRSNGSVIGDVFGSGCRSGLVPGRLADQAKARLLKQFKFLLAVIVDERNLVSLETMGKMRQWISETVYEGKCNHDSDWGGVPIVIFCGDDCQLPGAGRNAIQAKKVLRNKMMQCNDNSLYSDTEYQGSIAYLDASHLVMELNESKIAGRAKNEYSEIIQRLRLEKKLHQKHWSILSRLHLDNMIAEHGQQKVKRMTEGFIRLFRHRKDANTYNLVRLAEESGHTNITKRMPVLSKTINYNNDMPCKYKQPCHPTALCVGAPCSIRGVNFNPRWGLYNQAFGVVEDIVYEEKTGCTSDDLPQYVVVRFNQYHGPIWDISNPKSVPIPIVSRSCGQRCCTKYYIPLAPAYGDTVHNLQRAVIGSKEIGTAAPKGIICNLDELALGENGIGLLYACISGATTLGDVRGMDSAIYFVGSIPSNPNKEKRTLQMDTHGRDKKEWTNHLKTNINKSLMSNKEEEDVLNWSKQTQIPIAQVTKRIQQYITRYTTAGAMEPLTDNTHGILPEGILSNKKQRACIRSGCKRKTVSN